MKKSLISFKEWCYSRHDVVVNQKYDSSLPYSYHLRNAAAFADRFLKVLNPSSWVIAVAVVVGHDLIEDTRITYNELVDIIGKEVADSIYACTDLRGRNPEERKGPEFWKTIENDKIACFAKLCDFFANASHSIATCSNFMKKHIKTWDVYKEKFAHHNFGEMIEFGDKLVETMIALQKK